MVFYEQGDVKMSRANDLDQFYEMMKQLEKNVGGKRRLNNCHGTMDWPKQGVYFLFEQGETRANGDMRVIRVGTHAVSHNSKTHLWTRLRTHRGSLSGKYGGGGNHRASVFRKLVGSAIVHKEHLHCDSWDEGQSASEDIRNAEHYIEVKVSNYIRPLPFLWVRAEDEASKHSIRAVIEQNTIALLSNYGKHDIIDPPSSNWLGRKSPSEKVQQSGLWNQDYVEKSYDPQFLEIFENLVINQ
jgi:hypothetical protein